MQPRRRPKFRNLPLTSTGAALRRLKRVPIAALACWLVASAAHAQTYEVLNESIVRLGNAWQFDTVVNGNANHIATWEFAGTELVNGQETLQLREVVYSGGTVVLSADTWNVYLTGSFLMANRRVAMRFNPYGGVRETYTDPLEKIPRFVNASDDSRDMGSGAASVEDIGDPFHQSFRIQDQSVTFITTETVTVPAGTFECVTFRVTEAAYIIGGGTERAERTYRMNDRVGPVSVDYSVTAFDQFGTIISQTLVSHRLRFLFPAVPDLVLGSGATFSPDRILSGGALTVAWRELCLFHDVATTHVTTVYLTPDTTISPDDVRLIDARVVPPIVANQFVDIVETAILPAQVPSGDYRIAIVLDDRNDVDEFDERNTYFIDGTLTVEALPDLTVLDGSFTPDGLAPGESLTVRATVANIGGAAAPSVWAHVYLSTDTFIDGTDYPLITGIVVPQLGSTGQYELDRTAFVPPGFPERHYVVGIELDVGNAVYEANEANNAVALPQILTVGRPDLYVSSGRIDPAIVHAGQAFSVQATVLNGGLRPARPSWIHVYLSPDAVITASDMLLVAGLRSPELAPGETATVNATPSIPAGTALGSYYVGMIVDFAEEVVESNEANNAGPIGSTTLLLTTPPDLSADHLDFGPRVLNGGDPIAIAGFIRNATGAPTAGSCWVEFFVSPNPDFSEPRRFLCDSVKLPALGVGGSFSLASLQRTVYSDIPAGEYTFGVVIDRLQEVAESNEMNNTAWVSTHRLYIGQRPTGVPRWQSYP